MKMKSGEKEIIELQIEAITMESAIAMFSKRPTFV
jgi:hypothetical protein